MKEKRTKYIGIRLTEAEYLALKRKANQSNKQLAVYLRECGLSREIKAPLTIEQLTGLKNVRGMANNLNQITKHLHKEGLEETAEDIDKILTYLKTLLP